MGRLNPDADIYSGAIAAAIQRRMSTRHVAPAATPKKTYDFSLGVGPLDTSAMAEPWPLTGAEAADSDERTGGTKGRFLQDLLRRTDEAGFWCN
eukprot:NODE_7433_length_401_cov_154.923295_g5771_i0.p1 GENE.NODE_7433_length_401_cov_154.923295_g5771_i0~~NODE_7433_length_401_cov_154.923295_g5771_i0.p1  ORF type:complete len:102 (-),score=19.29 NODE_7433_length_401_cov_154.923295_g5771_i0:95-376(-)